MAVALLVFRATGYSEAVEFGKTWFLKIPSAAGNLIREIVNGVKGKA